MMVLLMLVNNCSNVPIAITGSEIDNLALDVWLEQ